MKHENVFIGTGLANEFFQNVDWTQHPLGPVAEWPPALKISLSNMFASRQPMVLMWGENHYQFFNDASLESFALDERRPKAMGMNGQETWPHIWDKLLPDIVAVMKGTSTWNEDVFSPIQKGDRIEEMYWSFGHSPIFDAAGNIVGVLAVTHNTTQRVLTNKALKAAAQAAERASATKSSFLANVSHEIRTPLTAILGFTEVLKQLNPSEDERRRYLEIISRNGHTLSKIIDDILDLSKIEAGKLSMEKVPLCLTELVHDVATMFSNRALNRGIELNIDTKDMPPFKVDSDPVRIRQILVNLIGNALKFTSHGHVAVHASLIDQKDDNVRVRFRINDTGIGLTQDQAKYLFTPFVQAVNSSTRKFGGTGLGLALSRKLARALKGDVKLFECSPGKGCTFDFELEVQKSKNTAQELPANVRVVTKSNIKKLAGFKVLVIDDTVDNRDLLEIFLKREGALVDVAADGETGVRLACDHAYDAVLMDIQMPGLDGYQALRKLQNHHYNKPVIALTAHALVEEKNRALSAGFADHIAKPVNLRKLTNTLLQHGRH